MKLPHFLTRLARQPAPTPAPAPENPGRSLARIRHNRERNRIIDRANEMAVQMGMPTIARRPE